jgi:hypothetical protein
VKNSVGCDYIPYFERRGPGNHTVSGALAQSDDEGREDEGLESGPIASTSRWDPTRRDDDRPYVRSLETVRYAPPPAARRPLSPYRELPPPPPQREHSGGRARASTIASTTALSVGGGRYSTFTLAGGLQPPQQSGGPHVALPPMRAASQASEEPTTGAKRRLSQSIPKPRNSSAGSKVVACNFCRGWYPFRLFP